MLEFPKEEQKLIRNVLSEEEVSALLEQIKPIGPEGRRNRAIVELLYACGIRTTELCHLRVADVDLKEQTVTIMKGKGGKSRVVPIGQYASHYIAEFRHSVATHMLRNEANVWYIAKLLGHASLKTTQKYLRVEIGDLKRVHSLYHLYHPRERNSSGENRERTSGAKRP